MLYFSLTRIGRQAFDIKQAWPNIMKILLTRAHKVVDKEATHHCYYLFETQFTVQDSRIDHTYLIRQYFYSKSSEV